MNTVNFIHDAQGQMVEQQNGSTYTQMLYSQVGKTAIMNGQTLSKAFVALPGGETAIYNSSGLSGYRQADWLGSSRLTTTTSRTVSSSSAYAPFGEQYATSGSSDASFTGQNADTVSGLYDFTFRKYSPSMGRWASPDPSGISAVNPLNPQSWNRYAYVLNNPMSYVDPLGLECVWDDGSYDAADDTETGNAAGCTSAGGTYIPPETFEGAEGTQFGDWSGSASKSMVGDWLTPSAIVNGNTPWTSADFTAMWQAWDTGILPRQLNYGPWTAETIDMSHNFAVDRAKAKYIKAGCPSSGTSANSMAAGHYEAAVDSFGNIALGQPDWLETEVGGWSGSITRSGDTTTFIIKNLMSNSSLLGATTFNNNSHALDNPNGPNGHKHNVMQTFQWTEQGLCHQ